MALGEREIISHEGGMECHGHGTEWNDETHDTDDGPPARDWEDRRGGDMIIGCHGTIAYANDLSYPSPRWARLVGDFISSFFDIAENAFYPSMSRSHVYKPVT